MSQQLNVELTLPGTTFLPMEAIRVRVTVRNGGPAPVDLPDENGDDPFTYLITRVDGAAPPETLSLARFAVIREGAGVAEVDEPALAPLPAGAERGYEHDMTAVTTSPLRPGGYEVTVSIGGPTAGRSAPHRFEIIAPAVVAIAATADFPLGYNGTAFADRSNGAVRLLQREGLIERPDLASFVAVGEAGGAVGGIGLTRALAPDQRNWRWVGWREGAVFHARFVWSGAVVATAGPTAVGEVELVPQGLHAADGTGTFFTIGAGAGPARLGRITVPRAGEPRFEPIAVSWPRLDLVLPWVSRDDDRFNGATLALLAELDGSVRIGTVDWTGAGGVSERAQVSGRLLAAAISPDGAAEPVVDVVTARGEVIERHRIPLTGGSDASAPVPVSAPPPGVVDPSWAIGTVESGDPVILLAAGPNLWIASGAGWNALPPATGPVSHPRLVSTLGTDLWAIWVDPELGARYRRVR